MAVNPRGGNGSVQVRKMSLNCFKDSWVKRNSKKKDSSGRVCTCKLNADANGEWRESVVKCEQVVTISDSEGDGGACGSDGAEASQARTPSLLQSLKMRFRLKPSGGRGGRYNAKQTVKVLDSCSNSFGDDLPGDGFAVKMKNRMRLCAIPPPIRFIRNLEKSRCSLNSTSQNDSDGDQSVVNRDNESGDNSSGNYASINDAMGEQDISFAGPCRDPEKPCEKCGTWCTPEACPAQPQVPARSLTCELFKLAKYGWYWGPISREEAEEKLSNLPDGTFLVRDSSADRYLLSVSFRSSGKTFHTRIEHSHGLFSFYSNPGQDGFESIIELINHSMSYSETAVFCYSRPRAPGHPAFPVRLAKPISRFTQVRSLQYLCRFVIRQYIRVDNIQKLPLPSKLKGYLLEGHY